MLISTLFSDPKIFLIVILAIIYALTIHEFSHALAAQYLGDDTPSRNGRLTLNPLAHMEFLGTLTLLLAGFGWGKPVPINTYNLKWQRWGHAFVALAGPVSNFVSVVLFLIISNILLNFLPINNLIFIFLFYLILVNLVLGVFNLIPIPPLDGSKVLFAFLPDRFDEFKRQFSVNGPWILIILIVLDNFMNINIFGHIFNFFINFISRFM